MIEFFTRLYPDAVSKKNPILNRIRFYSLIRFMVRELANALVPIYFEVTRKNEDYKLPRQEHNVDELIISLTSFPARIKKVHLVIESLLRQTQLPNRIILWLSKEQFPSEYKLPESLLNMQKRGLEIRFCEGDLRSHKKYYYVVKEFSNANFIIVDDDVFYPSTLVENLYTYHKRYPDTVCFNRGYKVKTIDEKIKPYNEWELLKQEVGPYQNIMPTGMGGVFYPREIFPQEILNKDVFMKECPYADDIWLYAMILLNNKQLVKSKENRLFLPILNKENKTLTAINVKEGKNDEQLKNIRSFYKEYKQIDVFDNLVHD